MLKEVILGTVRHIITALGGALVTSGTLNNTESNEAIGAIMVLVGLGWSVFQKYQTKEVTEKKK